MQDTNCSSHSAVLPGARECWRGVEQEGWGYGVVSSCVLTGCNLSKYVPGWSNLSNKGQMPGSVPLLQAVQLLALSTRLGASPVERKHPVSSVSLVSWPWLLRAAGSGTDQPANRNTTVQGTAQ